MFDAAARHLNFRRAAEELNLTQGAVAQQVRRLEQELGFKLFHRKARGLDLTESGKQYHGPIRQALGIIIDATESFSSVDKVVKISVQPSLAAKWLVPRLHEFQRSNPDIDVQVIATETLADFKSDGVDLAIRQGELKSDSDIEATLLAPVNLRAVCSPQYASDCRQIGDLSDFTAHPLIQDGHYLWDRIFKEGGITCMPRKNEFNQTSLAMEAAANGQGVALVAELLAQDDIKSGRLVEIWKAGQISNDGFYLLTPKHRKPKAAVRTIVQWCLEAAQKHNSLIK